MSASFLNVAKTFAKAVDDLALGITVVQENDDFQPPSSGQWAEMTMLSHETDSMGKSGSGDENTGALQISLFDADAGTLQGVLLGIADQLSAEFVHGQEYTLFTDTVYINRSFRNQGRMVGGFYQIDFTIEWICYSNRYEATWQQLEQRTELTSMSPWIQRFLGPHTFRSVGKIVTV